MSWFPNAISGLFSPLCWGWPSCSKYRKGDTSAWLLKETVCAVCCMCVYVPLCTCKEAYHCTVYFSWQKKHGDEGRHWHADTQSSLFQSGLPQTHTHISLLFRVLFLSWCFNSSVVQTSALNGNVFIKFGIAHLVEQASHMTKPYCRGLGSSLPRMLPMCYHPHSLLPFLSLTILTINIKKCQTYIYTSLQIKYYFFFFFKTGIIRY